MAVSDKIMFEIYREADYGRQYRIVYFTELEEHNKEREINRAMAGEHFYDGFLSGLRSSEGKRTLEEFVRRLNAGERVTWDQVEEELMRMEAVA